jgi:hypothetical protein
MNGFAFLAERINFEHDQYENSQREAIVHAIAAGEALIEAKEHVGHGKWLRWVDDHLDFSERTAQYYMRIARNPQRVADLGSVRQALAELANPTPRLRPRVKRYRTSTGWRPDDVNLRDLVQMIADHHRGIVDTNELYEYALHQRSWRWE